MKVITQEEFDKIYVAHLSWLHSDGIEGEKANLTDVDFTKLNIPNKLNLSKADLEGANFCNISLVNTVFSQANLTKANFRDAMLSDADFSGANLDSADLGYANLSRTNLSNAILSNAILGGATLIKANLSKANLVKANLTHALLVGTIVEGANFTEAKLIGIDPQRFDLSDAIFTQPDLKQKSLEDSLRKRNASIRLSSNTTKSIHNENIINNYYDEIKKLENERLSLIASAENKDAELKANKEHLNKLKTELQEREEQLKNTIEKINIDNIDKAFDTLIKSGSELTDEINLLEQMLFCYFGGAIGCLILLLGVWGHFFYKVESFVPTDSYNRMDLLDIWINLSPSVLLMGLLLFFIYQIHKCQRHKVILKKLLYKPKQIKGILEAYIYISGNNETSNIQINKVLDDYVCHIINHDIDTDKEESRLKETDKKDASTNEQLITMIAEIIKKIK